MEEWRPVKGYEQFYLVNQNGDVLSLRSGKLRKPVPNCRNGYLTMFLCGEHGKKCLTVHRIVATAFCEKPDGCDVVNHIDENKHNNNASNLEWVTKSDNNTYNYKTQRCCKSIEQIDESGTVIKTWPSAREAAAALGITYKNISSVCHGLRPRAGGYIWRFSNG